MGKKSFTTALINEKIVFGFTHTIFDKILTYSIVQCCRAVSGSAQGKKCNAALALPHLILHLTTVNW
jgi:hypothetical protein